MKDVVKTRPYHCQYLLVSQINYTLTNFADHCESPAMMPPTATCEVNGSRQRLVCINAKALPWRRLRAAVFDDTVLIRTLPLRSNR